MLSKKPIKKGVKIVQKIMYEGNKKYHTGLLSTLRFFGLYLHQVYFLKYSMNLLPSYTKGLRKVSARNAPQQNTYDKKVLVIVVICINYVIIVCIKLSLLFIKIIVGIVVYKLFWVRDTHFIKL